MKTKIGYPMIAMLISLWHYAYMTQMEKQVPWVGWVLLISSILLFVGWVALYNGIQVFYEAMRFSRYPIKVTRPVVFFSLLTVCFIIVWIHTLFLEAYIRLESRQETIVVVALIHILVFCFLRYLKAVSDEVVVQYPVFFRGIKKYLKKRLQFFPDEKE